MSQPAFIVSARKYRPGTFDTVVGQEHITTTLQNAIKSEHLAQAFLFCGPRGVGKTTSARILAKTINCENITEDIQPCNKCESCLNFNAGKSMNISELDAASNNSVEDIRHLIDQVRFPPQAGAKKVYIIDEVHMLSNQAFNAFLKTLEEPPPYAIFILATTEKHKIIPTILSRCQIFDFNRITVKDIAKHLKGIAQKENIEVEDEALNVIGEKADGALRDALSLFDLMVTYAAGKVLSYEEVVKNLHILDHDYFFRVVDAIIQQDIPTALLIFDEILKKGFDAQHFLAGLNEHLRNLLVAQDPATQPLVEASEKIVKRYQSQAGNTTRSFLLSALNIGNEFDFKFKSAQNSRLHVELALLKMAHIPTALSLSQVLDELKKKD